MKPQLLIIDTFLDAMREEIHTYAVHVHMKKLGHHI